jgi:hypothetical protein
VLGADGGGVDDWEDDGGRSEERDDGAAARGGIVTNARLEPDQIPSPTTTGAVP